MDAMKSYFDFTLSTRCGIPKVSLIGSNDDWKKLKDKVDHLCKLNENNRLKLDWWLQYLIPVIDNIVNTAVYGKVDTTFWQNLAKIDNGSGGPYFQGWINVFFPYLISNTGEYRFNNDMDYKVNNKFCGLKSNEVPQGISQVPLIWEIVGLKHDMVFYGGFLSTKVNEEESSVEPELGWFIQRLIPSLK